MHIIHQLIVGNMPFTYLMANDVRRPGDFFIIGITFREVIGKFNLFLGKCQEGEKEAWQ